MQYATGTAAVDGRYASTAMPLLVTSRHAICGSMAHHFLEEAARDDVQRLLALTKYCRFGNWWKFSVGSSCFAFCCHLLITLRSGQPISCVGLRPSGSHKLWAPGAWGVARRDWLRTDGKPRICSWPSLCTPANKAQLSLQCTQLTKLLSASHQPVRYQLSKKKLNVYCEL